MTIANKEFAALLRDIADKVENISDHPQGHSEKFLEQYKRIPIPNEVAKEYLMSIKDGLCAPIDKNLLFPSLNWPEIQTLASVNMENIEDRMRRLTDLLVEKGFATRSIVAQAHGHIVWTFSGRILCEQLKHLFGVPAINADDVSGHDVMILVGIILHTQPNG